MGGAIVSLLLVIMSSMGISKARKGKQNKGLTYMMMVLGLVAQILLLLYFISSYLKATGKLAGIQAAAMSKFAPRPTAAVVSNSVV
jgi:Ca2+/Na+ antiporter